jgi:hypothetical protein
MPTPKEDCEELMRSTLPLAERMLKEHGEFYPYAGHMTSSREIVHVGGKIEGTDHPKSQPLIELLQESFRKQARNGEIKATSIIFDVRITPPGSDEKTDAIQVCLDHRDGYSVKVIFPYKITNGELLFGQTFAQRGENKIFVSP